jgi:23S rRNA pseudouridine2605 synthase
VWYDDAAVPVREGRITVSRHRSRRNRSTPPSTGEPGHDDRLQKVLAAAGIGSRRECEELIVTGRVEVDGKTVTQLGTRVDPLQHEIRVDGVSLPRPKRVYYALNKPVGVVCSNRDPSGRVLAVDLIRSDERLFTVGRLDRTSEGLILITNDGALANRLTHPRYEVDKRYLVRVAGSPDPSLLTRLRRGIHLAEGLARVSEIFVRKRSAKFTDLEISLREGRNREIRRILARVGHKVLRLKRIAIGPLRLGMLPVGASRVVTRDEVKQLLAAASGGQRGKRQLGSSAARQDARNTRPEQSRGDGQRKSASAQRKASPGKHAKFAAPRGNRGPKSPVLQPHYSAPSDAKTSAGRPTDEFEPDELEIEAWEMDHPTGSVISFDDASSSGRHRPAKKKRRS